jgi:hypothetical protein
VIGKWHFVVLEAALWSYSLQRGGHVKLAQMKRTTGRDPSWAMRVADKTGREDYELTIRGPNALVSKVFEKSDPEIEIDPHGSDDTARKRIIELRDKYSRSAKAPHVDDGKGAFKKPRLKIDEKTSVVVSLRRIRGEGTFWAFFIPFLFIPRGANLLFALPPVFSCVGSVFPLAGDPDLFLTLNGVFTPTVAMSIRAGTAIDSVAFGPMPVRFPPAFVPFFRVSGFTTTLTGFLMAGI